MSEIKRSEMPLNPDGSVYHLAMRPEHVCGNVVLVGDPGRVKVVEERLDSVDTRKAHREFVSLKGSYRDMEVLVIGTGIGTENIEITLVEYNILRNYHVEKGNWENRGANIVRCGTCGSPQRDVGVGALAVTSYALGFDPLRRYYSIEEKKGEREIMEAVRNTGLRPYDPYCVSSSPRLVDNIEAAARAQNWEHRTGITASAPGFYAPQGRIFGNISSPAGEIVDSLGDLRAKIGGRELRVENIEMEASAVNLLSGMFGFRSAVVCGVLASRKKGAFADSEDYERAVNRAVDTGLQGLYKAWRGQD